MDATSPSNPYVLAPTTPKERELLRRAGFVHITGLVVRTNTGTGERDAIVGENTPVVQLGRWDANNGMIQIVTVGGEIWLAASFGQNTPGWLHNLQQEACRVLAPRGSGCWVHCSNGETIPRRHLMCRYADPDWMPTRH